VFPVLGLTVLFSVVPLVMVIQRSLYKGNIFGTDLTFAGLANYANVFRTGGGHSLVVTVVFTVGFVAVTKLLGFGIALLLDVRLPGVRHVRAFFVIPLVVPPVATAFIWFTFFQPGTGPFNRLLTGAGLPQVTLSNATDAMIAVIAFGAWQYFGEFVLIYLAALKALPRDVMEAASIDGAGAWRRLRYDDLPGADGVPGADHGRGLQPADGRHPGADRRHGRAAQGRRGPDHRCAEVAGTRDRQGRATGPGKAGMGAAIFHDGRGGNY
jgi:ABC-type sugar transport system permease subunit